MSTNSTQVLLVEDNPGDARLMHEMLSEPGPGSFELTRVGRWSEAVNHLASSVASVVLLDLGLPDVQGLDVVRAAHARAVDVPLVVLTGLDDEALAVQALQEGAQDYLIKGQIDSHSLRRALRYAIERQRMQTESDHLRTQQLQLKDEFLSHVSHELRSPLTAIYQFVTILLDGLAGELNPEQREYLQITLRNSRQLQSMIDDLLEVTRGEAGKLSIEPQCISVSEVIAATLGTLQVTAADKKIMLSSDIAADLAPACADPSRVQQILINMAENALKFTAAGGEVKIRAGSFEKDPRFLLLEVSDTGCGISPDVSQRIFERLYQVPSPSEAGRKGLGLGLYICKALVVRQGGQIWVSSELQHGSTFSFTLQVFSLAGLIAPVLTSKKRRIDPVALVIVEMSSPHGWSSKAQREKASQEVRSFLKRCLHPVLDVLLPKMDSAARELFFIVASANEKGTEVLTKRSKDQLERFVGIQQARLSFSVSYSLLDLNLIDTDTPAEDFPEKVATEIRELVHTATFSRSSCHE